MAFQRLCPEDTPRKTQYNQEELTSVYPEISPPNEIGDVTGEMSYTPTNHAYVYAYAYAYAYARNSDHNECDATWM